MGTCAAMHVLVCRRFTSVRRSTIGSQLLKKKTLFFHRNATNRLEKLVKELDKEVKES